MWTMVSHGYTDDDDDSKRNNGWSEKNTLAKTHMTIEFFYSLSLAHDLRKIALEYGNFTFSKSKQRCVLCV